MSAPSVSEAPETSETPIRRLPSPLWWVITSACLLVLGLSIHATWAGMWTSRGLYLEDFGVYVAAGRAIRDGQSLYEPGIAHLPAIEGTFKYTPFSGLLFTVLTVVPKLLLPLAALLTNLAALFVVVWVSFGRQGYARDAGRVAATAALAAFALGLQPVLANFTAGQVNVVLIMLILCDLTGRDRRWTGIGVGIAAGVKLIPLFFVVYLLVTKRFRAAAVAVGAFAATIAVGFVFLPGQSRYFWAANLVSPSRVTGDGDATGLENQTLRGMLARLVDIPDVPNTIWLPVALVVGVAGLVIAVRAHRTHRELLAVSVVGITMVLVSPLGWSHYWIWFVPFLAMGIGAALRSRSWVPWALIAAAYLLTFSWTVDHGRNNVPLFGLVFLPEEFPLFLQLPLHGLYTSLGLILLAVAAFRPGWFSEPVVEDEFLAKA